MKSSFLKGVLDSIYSRADVRPINMRIIGTKCRYHKFLLFSTIFRHA